MRRFGVAEGVGGEDSAGAADAGERERGGEAGRSGAEDKSIEEVVGGEGEGWWRWRRHRVVFDSVVVLVVLPSRCFSSFQGEGDRCVCTSVAVAGAPGVYMGVSETTLFLLTPAALIRPSP